MPIEPFVEKTNRGRFIHSHHGDSMSSMVKLAFGTLTSSLNRGDQAHDGTEYPCSILPT